MMMRASEEKHFSKPTKLTDFKFYLLFLKIKFIFIFYYKNNNIIILINSK